MLKLRPTMTGLLVLLALCACASAATKPTPTALPTPAVAGPGATTSGTTAAELADLARPVYALACTGCHGPRGQGGQAPALIGQAANLVRFGDAQKLLTYISTKMPVNRPGRLSADEYRQLLSLLLVENQFVAPNSVLDPDSLGKIALEK